MRNAALLMASVLCFGFARADGWPTLGHDLLRSGVASSPGPTKGTVAWSTLVGESLDGSPVVVADRVLVGNTAGRFCCLRRDNGEVVWSRELPGAIVGAAELADGRVFVGCGDGIVYALQSDDGKLLWRHRTNRPVLGGPTCAGGKVLFGSMDGTFRAVDPTTGRTLWKLDTGAPISAACAVQGDVCYFGDEHGGVHAASIADGQVIWSGQLAGRVIAAPSIAEGKLLVPLMSLSSLGPQKVEFLTAWSLPDGKKLWTAEPNAASVMGPVAVVGKTVWCFTVESYTSDGHLRGINLDTGQQVAEAKMGTLVVDAALAAAGDTLYMAAQNSSVYFMDAASGQARKYVRLGAKVFSSPAIADGRLYIGCQEGKLYCIE